MPFEGPFIAIRGFFEAGGDVLWGIFAVTALMWALIIERFWFFRYVLPKEVASIRNEWESRPERNSWNAQCIRRQLVSEVSIHARRNINLIQVLMVLLPLLGLLGTVTGMIQVFNVMAFVGTSNARLMAGFYLAIYLQRRASDEIQHIQNLLEHD